MSDQGVISLINDCKRRVPISLDDQGDLLGQVVLKLRPGGGAGLEAREPSPRWGSTSPMRAAERSWRVSDGQQRGSDVLAGLKG